MAIIAALSVVYLRCGMWTFHFFFFASSSKPERKPELAATPPPIAISVTPVCFTASSTFSNKIISLSQLEVGDEIELQTPKYIASCTLNKLDKQ